LDIGVLGYIGIVWPKEHSPEVLSLPPVTPCIYIYIYIYILCELNSVSTVEAKCTHNNYCPARAAK
jgi:hypothetical protein